MPKKPKKVEIPQRIKRIVETCKLGQKVCLTIRHSDVGDERLYWFEPSGRPAGTKSVEQAIEKGLLVPCHDDLFDHVTDMGGGMRRSHSEMADEMEKMSLSKLWWLNAFSQGRQKRPDHEIETRRMEHEVLCQAAADYRAAANRSAA